MKIGYLLKRITFIIAFSFISLAHAGYDFTLKNLDGSGSTSFSSYRGNIVIVDFWASWCGPCKEAFRSYNTLLGKHSNLKVIGINVDKDVEAAKRFLSEVSPSFPVVIDENQGEHAKKTYNAYGVQTMPTCFVFGPKGNLIKKIVGFRPGDESEIEKVIEEAGK